MNTIRRKRDALLLAPQTVRGYLRSATLTGEGTATLSDCWPDPFAQWSITGEHTAESVSPVVYEQSGEGLEFPSYDPTYLYRAAVAPIRAAAEAGGYTRLAVTTPEGFLVWSLADMPSGAVAMEVSSLSTSLTLWTDAARTQETQAPVPVFTPFSLIYTAGLLDITPFCEIVAVYEPEPETYMPLIWHPAAGDYFSFTPYYYFSESDSLFWEGVAGGNGTLFCQEDEVPFERLTSLPPPCGHRAQITLACLASGGGYRTLDYPVYTWHGVASPGTGGRFFCQTDAGYVILNSGRMVGTSKIFSFDTYSGKLRYRSNSGATETDITSELMVSSTRPLLGTEFSAQVGSYVRAPGLPAGTRLHLSVGERHFSLTPPVLLAPGPVLCADTGLTCVTTAGNAVYSYTFPLVSEASVPEGEPVLCVFDGAKNYVLVEGADVTTFDTPLPHAPAPLRFARDLTLEMENEDGVHDYVLPASPAGSFPAPLGLAGTGNYRDTFRGDGHGGLTWHRRWGVLELTSDLSPRDTWTTDDGYALEFALPGGERAAASGLTCSHFPTVASADADRPLSAVTLTSDGTGVIFLLSLREFAVYSDDMAAECFGWFLDNCTGAGTPLTVVYKLATPIVRSLPAPADPAEDPFADWRLLSPPAGDVTLSVLPGDEGGPPAQTTLSYYSHTKGN